MTKLAQRTTALLSSLLVGGCAAPNYNAFVEQYDRVFRDANPHSVHAVARSDGPRINVREFGRANKGQTPTIVMMHGFPDSQHLYDLVIPPLAKDRHVITFDFLGWGDSEKPTGHRYDPSSLRKDIEAAVSEVVNFSIFAA